MSIPITSPFKEITVSTDNMVVITPILYINGASIIMVTRLWPNVRPSPENKL